MDNRPTTQLNSSRLDLLYRLSQAFNSSLDLEEVLNKVMDEVILAVKAERGFVMLSELDRSLEFKVARGMDHKTINDPEFQVSRSIVEKVAHEGQPVLTSDAQKDDRFSMHQSIMLLGLRSILCVPLLIKERTIGVIYVDNTMQTGIFSPSDLDLLSAIAWNAAIAIENARLYQLAVEKGRLERELQVARQVQVSLLPERAPDIPGWEIVATWQPARQVAGDYYDFFSIDNGSQGMLIADVTDKGMPAALFMAMTRSTVRASLESAGTPAEGIAHANKLIASDSSDGMFVTLFYAELNPVTAELVYVNAGHNPPIYIHQTGSGQFQITNLSRTGIALGVITEVEFHAKTLKMSPGDVLLMYTDGVTDAINPQGDSYDEQRLHDVLLSHASKPAECIASEIITSLQNFAGDRDPYDDITYIILKRK